MAGGRAAIVIPALNEAGTIAAVVRAAGVHGAVIVVDDGSADDTAARAAAAGAQVVRHAANRGYDAALDSGLRAARALGADFAVSLDADGQLDPDCLPRVLELLRGGAGLVLGRRARAARWSEALFNAWTRRRYGVADILCGLKGYGPDLLDLAAGAAAPGLLAGSLGTGLALAGLRRGCVAAQLDVPVRPRRDASRIGGGLKANLRILRALRLAAARARAEDGTEG